MSKLKFLFFFFLLFYKQNKTKKIIHYLNLKMVEPLNQQNQAIMIGKYVKIKNK